jgi:photosystem II stability/assembly factor-like uncharacterized protein
MVIDYETVFAIGDKGLMLRGSLENGTWSWKKLELDTTINLNSLAYREGRIWIVGEAGLIMESADQGNTWARTQIKDEAGNLPNLKRLRFFPDGGWIVGQGIVLKSSAP